MLWPQSMLVVGIALWSVTSQNPLSSWVGQKPFDEFSSEAVCANYSRTAWRVSANAETLAVARVDAREGRRRSSPEALEQARSIPDLTVMPDAWIGSVKYGEGWLIGFDRGEFGGGLWWRSEHAGQARRLSTENVRDFLMVDGKLLVLSGLDHQGRNYGHIFEVIVDDSDQVGLRIVADVGAPPDAVHVDRGSLLVATRAGVARVSLGGAVGWLSRTSYMWLGPRSIVRLPSGAVYVGANRYVVELIPNPGTYAETWYVPRDCVYFKVDEDRLECECRPSR